MKLPLKAAIFFISATIIFFYFSWEALAYSTVTHKSLTKASVDLFNAAYPNLINDETENKLMEGAEHEDTTPRWLNHFYDPIYNRGLTIGLKSWLSSKIWAQSGADQLAFTPEHFLARIFSAKGFSGNLNYTWQAAIDLYQQGEKEEAMFALGHVLHLLQDASVPDHTRNDPHPGNSPFENFSKYQIIPDAAKNIAVLPDLNTYFDTMAGYSNGNFYSKDTIGLGKYKKPEPDFLILDNGYAYGVKQDEFGEYFLFRKTDNNFLFSIFGNISIDTPEVLQGYWDRLSVKSVEFSAGLLRLFYETVGELDGNYGAPALKQNSNSSAPPALTEQEAIENSLALLAQISGLLNEMAVNTAAADFSNREQQALVGGIGGNPTADEGQDYDLVIAEDNADNSSGSNDEDEVTGGGADSGSDDNTADQNFEEVAAPAEISGVAAITVVINEFLFDAEGSDSGKEFIELYNPTSGDINLSNWSIQTENGSKKNFAEGDVIKTGGHFLIWLGDNPEADMQWKSGSLKNKADSLYLVDGQKVVSGADDPAIVDLVAYDVSDFSDFAAGFSLRRKIFKDGSCLEEINNDNRDVCDTGNTTFDFMVNNQPSPLNSGVDDGLSDNQEGQQEISIDKFNVFYDKDTLTLKLDWESQAESFNVYNLTSGTSIPVLIYSGADKEFLFGIDEVGRDYLLGVSAVVSGEESPAVQQSVSVPSFLDFVNFYQSSADESFVIDLGFSKYPFVPGSSDKWKILAFYKDGEAEKYDYLDTSGNWLPEAAEKLLPISYPTYASNIQRQSLILPDTKSRYGSGGGVENSAFKYEFIEDGMLRIKALEPANYISIAFYDFYSSGGGSQNFQLKAIDKNEYFLQEQPPAYQPPALIGELQFNFNKQNSLLEISWEKALDPDTLDQLISYDVLITDQKTGEESLEETYNNSYQMSVAAGDKFNIKVKAKDEFKNESEEKSADWVYPEPQYLVNQAQSDGWSGAIGAKNQNCPSCPASASFQSLEFSESVEFNSANVRVNHEQGDWTFDLQLSVYKDNGENFPDFNQLIASKKLTGILKPDPEKDLTFAFNQPASLDAGQKYWLMIDVPNYSDHRAYFSSSVKNAIVSSGNNLQEGEAGMGYAGVCDNYCDFKIPAPNAEADWYLKLGLEN